MAVTIDATNMVEIDDADQTTGWTSSMGGLSTTTLGTREGGTALQDQASEEAFEVYHTITSEDYTDRTIFGWQLSGAPSDSSEDAGFAMYLGDGTDAIAYAVGGNDNYGFFFLGWSNFRLNTASLPTADSDRRVISGIADNITLTAITQVGYGGDFPAKAAGNSDNVKFDILRYVDNADPALLVEGGTTGDRGTFQEIVTDDESTTNAWGIARILIPGSKAYQLNFGVQLGSLDSDSYFEDSDFQLYLNGDMPQVGAAISAGSMDVDCVGDSGSTNVVNFDNFFIQSIGTVSNWTMSADLDEAMWTNGQFVDMGTFTFPAQDAGQKFLADCTFVNCGQVDPSTLDFDRISFIGTTDADGAMLLDASGSANMADLTFASGGEGNHGIEVTAAGSYTLDTFTFTGHSAQSGVAGSTFHTISGINESTEILTTDAAHGLVTGELAVLNDDGGTDTVGLTEGTLYYVNAQSTTTLSFHNNLADALSDDTRVDLSAGGDGETQTIYSGNAAVHNNSGGAVTLTINGGTTPSIRNTGASTTTVVLSPVTTQIEVRDEDDAVMQNARVMIEASDGAGDLPFEDSVTITRSGATATVSHTAHGMSTNDKMVIRGADQDEYNCTAQITVTDANTYTYTVSGSPTTPATGTIESTGVVLEGLTNASGIISIVRSFTVDQNILGKVRRSSASPYYKSFRFTDVIDNLNGLTRRVSMIRDD